jgi:hypothetical protein
MMTLPDSPPTRAHAGATWTWTFQHPAERPAPTWAVAFAIVGKSQLEWNPAWVTVSGQISTIAIPYNATDGLDGGTYDVTQIETSSTERVMTTLAPIAVLANPLNAQPGSTRAARLETLIGICDALLEGRATDGMMSFMVFGRQMMSFTLAEIRGLRKGWVDELRAVRRKRGGFGRAIHYRFGRTS